MLFLLYPSLSMITLDTFNCREILGEYYLVADMEARCYTTEWANHAVFAVIGVALYPVGIPAFFYYMLRSHEDELVSERLLQLLHRRRRGRRGGREFFRIV